MNLGRRITPPSWSRHRLATNIGFALAILLLSWVGWHARRDSARAQDSAREVSHTHDVLETLDALLISLHQAEAGQRTYIIGGSKDYLTPYYHSAARIAGQLGQLRELTADNPIQQSQLGIVAGMTTRRLGVLDQGISLRRTRGRDAAIALVLAGRGAALMDSARSTISDMQAVQRDLLRSRSRQSEALVRQTAFTILLASGLGLLLLATSAVLANREIGARLAAEAELLRANEGLEERVAERTEQLQSQKEQLRTTADELKALVQAAPVAILGLDNNGKVVSWYGGAEKMFGWTADEVIGRPPPNLPTEKQEEFRTLLARVVGGNAFTGLESQRMRKDGTLIDVSISTAPLHDGAGRAVGIIGVYQDITERRRAEDLYHQMADQLEALVRAAPVAIVGIDMEGKVLSWYGGAERLFGWSAAEVVDRPLANVPPEKQEEFHALRTRVLHGDSVIGLETQRMRKDGSRIDVSLSYAPLHDRTGRTIGATIVYQDVTERRLAFEQRQAREAADAANRAKSNFLANMSHELRTPLNAIIGFSELLEDDSFGTLNERQKRYVTNVRTSGNHLLQLVNDILDLAKIESGRLVLEPESINLNTLLHDMQRGLEPLAVAKRQTFLLEIPDELPPVIADRGKVKQILYNLLSNAIKFTKPEGRVGVRAKYSRADHSQPQVEIAVWDTGIGIAPEDLKRVFLEFEQLDSSYVRQQEGTGLGLALTQRLIEAHGGRIWVESMVDKGSTFTFALPASPAVSASEPVTKPPVRILGQNSQRPLVLVVEDDTTGRELLNHYLVENGYAVAYATTGAEAIELARQLKPAAISLDILLPDEHGLHILSKLRADPETKDIPVVVVSITDDRDLGLSAGAAAWLVKPVQRRQFIEALDRVMPNGKRDGKLVALVVDDDVEAVDLATDILRQRGFEVLQAFGGTEGLTLALERLPSLIILDLSMPGVSGFTVAKQLRANPRTRHTPILVSTALDLSATEREELLRHVQTIVPKSGGKAILEALERLGLSPQRPSESE
jgi:PAS domain S-box-containing protein